MIRKAQKVHVFSPEEVAEAWARERPDLNPDGLGITIRIRALAMIIDQFISHQSDLLKISQSDLLLLFAMRRSGEPYCMRPTDVFRLLSVTSGAATYRIDRLVKRGIVERVPDLEDRRSHVIQLTNIGRDMVDWATSTLSSASDQCLANMQLARDEFETLGILLSRLEQAWVGIIPSTENPLARSEPLDF